METFTNSIGLGMAGFGASMFDATGRQEELVVVSFWAAAKLGAPVGQHSNNAHSILFETRKDLVIQHIGSRHGRLGGVQLGKGHLRIGVHHGLLVDAPHALESADIEGVLANEVTGMVCLDFPRNLKPPSSSFRAPQPGLFVSRIPSSADFFSRAERRCFMVARLCRNQTLRTPKAEMKMPRLRNSFEARTCPCAGCSMA